MALVPDDADAFAHRGKILRHQSQASAAVANFRRALRLRPDSAEAWSQFVAALHMAGRYSDACHAATHIVALAPGSVATWQNLAVAAPMNGWFESAVRGWRHACTLDPENAFFHRELAFNLLRCGNLAEGWREYEWRIGHYTALRSFDQPVWDGGDLHGKTILVYNEQGLGDTIQFVRFAAILQSRGARTVVECPRQLLRLFTSTLGADQWFAQGDAPPDCDVYVPLMSVPKLLGITMAGIPAMVPYLKAEPDRVEHWRRRIPADGLRVGIIWQGSLTGRRSLPLACLAPLAAIPGVRLISLQKGDGVEQLADLPADMRVETLGEDFDAGPDAFLDTAAVAMVLDLIVTVDTSVGHVAAALGRPVWRLLTMPADWRWFLDRDDTPWYPETRLFRQPAPGDWQSVVAAVTEALTTLAHA